VSNVVFEDYSVKVKNAIAEKVIASLYEVGGEMKSRVARLSRRKTSQTAGSYDYKVDEGGLAVHIGSDYQNAIWEEFGTGEHAMNGDGRKGWWVYVTGSPSKSSSTTKGKSYRSPKQAEMAVALLRDKGLDAHMTKGKTANRPLYRTMKYTAPRFEKRLKEVLGEL
jgi:hypothetical protein